MNGNGFHLIHEDSNGKKAGLVTALDGCRIYVETVGSGTPILLVHGWTMSGVFWRHQMAGLRDRFQVVTMDLRAHGNSSKTMEGHTIEGYATDVRAVITALNLERVVLAGWSLAGPVVLAYWRKFGGDRLSAMVLVEMTPFPYIFVSGPKSAIMCQMRSPIVASRLWTKAAISRSWRSPKHLTTYLPNWSYGATDAAFIGGKGGVTWSI